MNHPSRIQRFSGLVAAGWLALAASTAFSYPPPAKVNLGTAGYFAVLAQTAITTTAGTSITGDIGISPAAASYITGFALVAPPTSYTTSAMVTGKVFAADYDDPTPTNMGIAVGDMYTAYTNAAGRAPDATELYSGLIGGQTFTTGVYKWSTDVTLETSGAVAADITLTGSATDVWIFEIAGNLIVPSGGSVGTGVHVTLGGAALASNVFWQVGGVAGANIGTYATFNGNILAAKQIVVQTGAVFNGRALSQTQVTLDNNLVGAPAAAVALKSILAATSATATGQSVLLMLTVTNTGTSNAINVTASIWNDGASGFDGPTPDTVASLTPGSAVTFTWSATLTGAYTFHYSATASETSQPVSSLRAAVLVALPKAGVSAHLATVSSTLTDGSFLLALTVSNSGQASAYVSLTTTAFQLSGPGVTVTTYVGPAPAQPVLVGPGSTVHLTWTVTAGSLGAGRTISNTVYVTDLNGGPPLPFIVITTAQPAAAAPATAGGPSAGDQVSYVYPSPAVGAASIAYAMAESGTVRIRVYNAAGQLVDSLEESKPAGSQRTAITTAKLAPGVYFYLLERHYASGTTNNIGPRKFVVTR